MIEQRTLVLTVAGLALSTCLLHGQDRSRYRDFQLGRDLPSISALTGKPASEARTVHQRPALMQELEWRRPYSVSDASSGQTDPVQVILFSFYNDQLSRMVIDYDRNRTVGMTDADMIEAISTMYGPPLAASRTTAALSQLEEESGTRLARFGDASCAVVLYRSSYASGFRLIVTSPRLDALARTAGAQAVRLDEREAPQRELARQKKEAADTRASEEKSRLANKAAFRP